MGGDTAHFTFEEPMKKTEIVFGERITKTGEIKLGCSAIIFSSDKKSILLTKRSDNGQWCLPGGRMEAGESAKEACARETYEETGLEIEVVRLLGVYSDPNRLVVYPDGKRIQIVALSFEGVIKGGELRASDETTDWGYYTIEEARRMEMLAGHLERIEDAYAWTATVIK